MMYFLKRSYTKPFDDIPLTWKPVKTIDNPWSTASIVCANEHNGIIDEHTIDDEGVVSPSVVCTQDGCNFHEFVTLVGWKQ